MAIDRAHRPSERTEFFIHGLIAANIARVTGDLEGVVVENAYKIVELVMRRGHCSFPIRAFGQFAIAEQSENAMCRIIEFSSDRHPNRNREAMSERAGVHFDARNLACRMPDKRRLVLAKGVQIRIGKKSAIREDDVESLD